MSLTFCAILGKLLSSLGLNLLTWPMRVRRQRLRLAHPNEIKAKLVPPLGVVPRNLPLKVSQPSFLGPVLISPLPSFFHLECDPNVWSSSGHLVTMR